MKSVFLFLILIISCFGHDIKDDVLLYLKSKHQFQYAGFYIAKEKGFYKEYGLNVTIKESNEFRDTINLVLENTNSFGISDSALIYEKMLGKKISPLGAIFQHSPLTLLSLKKSEINTPNDLKNKRIILDFDSIDNTLFNAIKNKYSLNEKNIQIPTPKDINSLNIGKTDIYTTSLTSKIFPLQEKGIEYNYIYPSSLGFDFYGDILFTSEVNTKINTKKVKDFYKASIKGWKYAFENI